MGDSVNLCKLVLSLFNDAELSQGHLGMRDDLSDHPPIPRGIKEGESGVEWQLYALSAFQMLSEFLRIKLLNSVYPFLPVGKQEEAMTLQCTEHPR